MIIENSEMAVSELNLTMEEFVVFVGNFEVWKSRG